MPARTSPAPVAARRQPDGAPARMPLEPAPTTLPCLLASRTPHPSLSPPLPLCSPFCPPCPGVPWPEAPLRAHAAGLASCRSPSVRTPRAKVPRGETAPGAEVRPRSAAPTSWPSLTGSWAPARLSLPVRAAPVAGPAAPEKGKNLSDRSANPSGAAQKPPAVGPAGRGRGWAQAGSRAAAPGQGSGSPRGPLRRSLRLLCSPCRCFGYRQNPATG